MTTMYGDVSQRIGKWGPQQKAYITAVAKYQKTLESSNPEMKDFITGAGTQAVFRRWKNYGNLDWTFTSAGTTDAATAFAQSHLLAEGVSPGLDSITPVDITVNVQQYGMAYGFTDKTFTFHEDDLPAEMKRQMGERKGTLEEMIDFAVTQGGTQVIYGGGGLSRSTVSKELKLAGLRAIFETLLRNSAPLMTSSGQAGPAYGSEPPRAGGCAYCHVNVLSDATNITDGGGWIPREKYAGRKARHPMEHGSVETTSFIFSPHLQPILDAGVVTGSAPTLRANSTNVDVYMTLVFAQNAWGKFNTNKANSFEPSALMPNQVDKSDFLGQRGVFGMKFWAASVLLREGYMYRYEHGVTKLSSDY